jgi:hypothetical protein
VAVFLFITFASLVCLQVLKDEGGVRRNSDNVVLERVNEPLLEVVEAEDEGGCEGADITFLSMLYVYGKQDSFARYVPVILSNARVLRVLDMQLRVLVMSDKGVEDALPMVRALCGEGAGLPPALPEQSSFTSLKELPVVSDCGDLLVSVLVGAQVTEGLARHGITGKTFRAGRFWEKFRDKIEALLYVLAGNDKMIFIDGDYVINRPEFRRIERVAAWCDFAAMPRYDTVRDYDELNFPLPVSFNTGLFYINAGVINASHLADFALAEIGQSGSDQDLLSRYIVQHHADQWEYLTYRWNCRVFYRDQRSAPKSLAEFQARFLPENVTYDDWAARNCFGIHHNLPSYTKLVAAAAQAFGLPSL